MRVRGTTQDGIVLTMETGQAGAFEDWFNQIWTAEAYRGGNPVAEGSGSTPLDAVMALAQALCVKVNGEAIEYRLNAVEDAQAEAMANLTPAEQAAVAESRERINRKRAEARAAELRGDEA